MNHGHPRFLLPALALLAAGAASASPADLPQLGKSPTKDVVAAMTREEKVSLVVGAGMRRPGASADRQGPVVGEPVHDDVVARRTQHGGKRPCHTRVAEEVRGRASLREDLRAGHGEMRCRHAGPNEAAAGAEHLGDDRAGTAHGSDRCRVLERLAHHRISRSCRSLR